MMRAMEKTISFILQIIILSTSYVISKPCSKSNSECKTVRMPLMSNDLKAPLIAELDISSVNEHLESYINAGIKSSFSEEVKDMVKNEQEQTKTSMLQDYSLKLNTTKQEYDNRFLNILQNLEAKQKEITLEVSEVYKNLSESESTFDTEITDLLSGFEHRQESLNLSLLSEYRSELQKSKDANNKKINDLAKNLKSKISNLSDELKEQFVNNTMNIKTQRKELEEWKTHLIETFKETFASIKYMDCSSMRGKQTKPSGVYTIYPNGKHSTKAYCDMSTDGGGWTVIQRRLDGTTDFYRDWNTYKNWFGDVAGEYWLGNDNIHTIVSSRPYTLRIDLEDFSGKTRYAEYTIFKVGDENSNYLLNIGGYSGTAGDLMGHSNGNGFSTTDRDNDSFPGGLCTKLRHGCFWYAYCTMANLNGKYYPGGNVGSNSNTIYVWTWVIGHKHPMKTVVMKIR